MDDNIDRDLNLMDMPDPWIEPWPDSKEVLSNLQRIIGHFSLRPGARVAFDTLWWAEQIIKNLETKRDGK